MTTFWVDGARDFEVDHSVSFSVPANEHIERITNNDVIERPGNEVIEHPDRVVYIDRPVAGNFIEKSYSNDVIVRL